MEKEGKAWYDDDDDDDGVGIGVGLRLGAATRWVQPWLAEVKKGTIKMVPGRTVIAGDQDSSNCFATMVGYADKH